MRSRSYGNPWNRRKLSSSTLRPSTCRDRGPSCMISEQKTMTSFSGLKSCKNLPSAETVQSWTLHARDGAFMIGESESVGCSCGSGVLKVMPEGHTRLHNQWAGHDTGRSDLTIVAWILHDATNCLLFWGCRVIGGVINQVQNVTKNVNVFQTDLYMNPLSETLERTLVPSMRLLTARVFLAKQRSASMRKIRVPSYFSRNR